MVCCSLMSKDHHEQPTSHPHDSHHLHRAHPGISPYHWTSGKLFSALQATTWPMAWWWLQTKNNRRSIIGYHWQHFLSILLPHINPYFQDLPCEEQVTVLQVFIEWWACQPRPPWLWLANQCWEQQSKTPLVPLTRSSKILVAYSVITSPLWYRNLDSHCFDKVCL